LKGWDAFNVPFKGQMTIARRFNGGLAEIREEELARRWKARPAHLLSPSIAKVLAEIDAGL